jgi:hypothetical protein
MENDFNFLVSLWKNYNNASALLTKFMGGTLNEVGEFAERLVARYYDAEKLPPSNKSADLRTAGNRLIQVKSRKIECLATTSLGIIRSWQFDLLVVVLFSKKGDILKAVAIDAKDAKALSRWDSHQNGHVLTTSGRLLDHPGSEDITEGLQGLLDGPRVSKPESGNVSRGCADVFPMRDFWNPRDASPKIGMDDERNEINRVQRRVKRWFERRWQINSKILYAFMDLYEKNGEVRYDDLRNAVNIETFWTNFEQMKTIAPHNHGKIFEQTGNYVVLWDKVETFILDHYHRHVKQ